MRGASRRSTLVRDALVIVATGVVLGAAFNQLERTRRPPRGLPWVASERTIESVESVMGVGGAPVAGSEILATNPGPRPGAPVPVEPPVRSPLPAASLKRAMGSPAAAAAAPVPAETAADSAAPSIRPDAAAALRAGLPEIPDLGRPLNVGLPTVAKLVEADAALVVDARERVEFAAGHIPGAVNVPFDDAVRDPAVLERLDAAGRPIIVYCSGGTCEASRLLAEMMVRDYGMRRVLVFEAGYPEWVASGQVVAREDS